MITLQLDWHEVLWWMQGGMSGSHLQWNVYSDMVNHVWPQCSEQERRNIWLIMRRDLGSCWRPGGWSGFDIDNAHGEGEWRPEDTIHDKTPWMYFRQVLARFDPENQYAVTMSVHNAEELDGVLLGTPEASIISIPSIPHTIKAYNAWQSDTATVTVRAYRWQDGYYINWCRRCDPDKITKIEKLEIPDEGTM